MPCIVALLLTADLGGRARTERDRWSAMERHNSNFYSLFFSVLFFLFFLFWRRKLFSLSLLGFIFIFSSLVFLDLPTGVETGGCATSLGGNDLTVATEIALESAYTGTETKHGGLAVLLHPRIHACQGIGLIDSEIKGCPSVDWR